ncbi:MAG: ATP-binding protein [Rhodoferax sp.]|nr:ATP-binding protein [Rhodoferax sp.]
MTNSALFFDASPVASFVVDTRHMVTHFNQACALTLGIAAQRVIGRKGIGWVFHGDDRPMMADLIVDDLMEKTVNDLYQSTFRCSLKVPHAYETEHFFPKLGQGGRWLFFTAAPLRNAQGELVGAIETLQDITERKVAEDALMKAQLEVEQIVEQRTSELGTVNQTLRDDVRRRETAERELQSRNNQLQALNSKLSEVKEHLIQSEKLASIGQLAAGIAHEINNPIGYIFSNFGTLEGYLTQLFEMLDAYQQAEATLQATPAGPALKAKREAIELDFLKEDIPVLMRESKEGIVRVRKIVQDLKDFSHVDSNPDWQLVSLNQGIDSTLNVINNEIKYKADLVKQYADLPEVQCMPSQINQVVMNLVVNAAQAMGPERGKITVRTGLAGEQVWLEVADTGSGIPPEVLPRIFDPFYTTKPIGKGTGLGLSLAYGFIQKHHGKIEVTTELGQGSTFRVTLPVKQPAAAAAPSPT